ncbi:Protein msa (Modulator of sarA) [Staphylococcus aureus]|nr:Protein msa (Modulator of sarA) [Staphylococcus aureus]
MKYLILSLVANLLVFGVLSAIGLNINILAAMMIVLVIPIMISGILFFKTNIDKTYIFFNIIFIDFYYYIYNVHLMTLQSSPDSCVKCYTMFLPFLLIKIDVFS